MKNKIKYIDEVEIKNKRVLLRADFDVSLNSNYTISNDLRIKNNLPTIKYLLKNQNKIICVAKLGRPKGRDPKFSLQVIADRLKTYLIGYEIKLVSDFRTETPEIFKDQTAKQILILENIRFYQEEQKGDINFAKNLASLAEVYVEDAFSMCHRLDASVVDVPKFLPSYGGLLLKKEIETISSAINNPRKPFVAIVGGAKVKDKIGLIRKLIEITDYVLIGGGLANPFLSSMGFNLGKTNFEKDLVSNALDLIKFAKEKNTQLLFPSDIIGADPLNLDKNEAFEVKKLPSNMTIFDLGPQTQALWGEIITNAKTVIWNGPVGVIEESNFRRGTDFIFYAIADNKNCTSIIGGGDTISAISKDEFLNSITHISTGGGAMLEFIEKGTLPGIEVLKNNLFVY